MQSRGRDRLFPHSSDDSTPMKHGTEMGSGGAESAVMSSETSV